MKTFKGLSVLLAALVVLVGCTADETETNEETETTEPEIDELVLGFFPSADVENMAETAEPFGTYLSEELDIPVSTEVLTDYSGLIEAMRNQHVDIAFLPPFAYVQAEERAEAEVLLKAIRNGSATYRSQYSVPADSDIETVDDLVETEGLVWAFTDYASTSGYLFPAQQLMDKGVEDLDEHFMLREVGAHDRAILALVDGQADFATTFQDARVRLEEEIPDINEQVRVIGTTDEIPNATLSVRSELPEDVKAAIEEAFLAINDNEEMLGVLDAVYNWEGFAPAESEDYDIVREVYEEFQDSIE
ncbi:phosphonate transport system substrate-binding protein [Alkalibacterium subtropicum]|uniref:Phosphonate transport system substrate-binding protein n=1 Tax=Alkalibacterium subtropicum TaxID=753702 RepID=A0A1I1KNY7_9LACT|nr:phosphate/phosphite/phosphonate ABC transporter substrate-binding protein [Alkalibacterium subtropicum]SFC59160.1 phosphonate transport system substrate-binding protein [Alkalibacterium subtropicum]